MGHKRSGARFAADNLDIKSRVADRLGMTWGAFSAMCADKYPGSRYPIADYIADPANGADTSPPRVSEPTSSSRVHLIRHCRWCGAEIPTDTLAYYCGPEHKRAMILHKAAICNRISVIQTWLREGKGNKERLLDEQWALQYGIRPGKPISAQCPATVAKFRRTDSPRNHRLLSMIKEE